MEILQAIVLGLVQGITEFLPVSSSGHLVLLEKIWAIDEGVIFYNVILHISTLLAVVIYYRKRLWNMLIHPFNKTNGFLILATIPTVLIVVIFHSFFENAFSGGLLVVGFMLTAIFLILTEWVSKVYDKQKYNFTPVTWQKSLMLGIFQGLAVLPGLSRSGTTVCAGIVMGIDKKQAIDFSFLMSIPIILASMVYEMIGVDFSGISIDWLGVIIGSIFAFIFAILGIKLMLKLTQKVQYYWFAIYLVVLSIVTLWVV